jgi:hypothetical protein
MLGPSTRRGKRFMITLDGKTFHFGSKNGSTYIDHGDKKKRENYIKRHQVNEDWTTVNPGSLSRFILWGSSTSIEKNMREFNRMFPSVKPTISST